MGQKRAWDDEHEASPSRKKIKTVRIHGYPLQSKPPFNPDVDTSNLPPLPEINDAKLREQVFTHDTALLDATKVERVQHSYERLELLGDAYLEVMASRLIYREYPLTAAGRISQIREILIRNESLAVFSQAYGFDARLRLAQATAFKAYARAPWIKVMGDVMEAYVAGIVEDDPGHGFDRAEEWLTALWRRLLPKVEEPPNNLAKMELARQIGGVGVKLEYSEAQAPTQKRKGGITTFTLGVYLTGWGYEKHCLGSAQGLSKSEAGHRAAQVALESPLLSTLVATKKEFDKKVKEERKAAQAAQKTVDVAD